jgi:acyl-CoA hydrolase
MLDNHKDLGIHTEMFSDGIMDLVAKGVVTGMQKSVAPGKIVGSFALGSQRLFDFMHENPSIAMLDCAFVNVHKYSRLIEYAYLSPNCLFI